MSTEPHLLVWSDREASAPAPRCGATGAKLTGYHVHPCKRVLGHEGPHEARLSRYFCQTRECGSCAGCKASTREHEHDWQEDTDVCDLPDRTYVCVTCNAGKTERP